MKRFKPIITVLLAFLYTSMYAQNKNYFNDADSKYNVRVQLGSFTSRSVEPISSNTIKTQVGLYTVLVDQPDDINCKILGFEVYLMTNDKTYMTVTNQGSLFSIQTKDLLSRCQSGDVLLFRNIRYQCPQDGIKKYEDMTFRIK